MSYLFCQARTRTMVSTLLVVFTVSALLCPATSFDFFSAVNSGKSILVNGLKSFGAVAKKAFCYKIECCTDRWTSHNLTGLDTFLKKNVFGQHIVVEAIVRLVRAHRTNPRPTKALVLSLHGATGTGKNFVSRIVAEHLFRRGEKSGYYHTFIATHHFPHEGDITRYRKKLRDWIRGNVSACGQSLFIFDEMDKLPRGLIDVLTPFVDHHPEVDGVDFRHSVFLFLSNLGGKQINDITFHHWEEGRTRSDLAVRHFDPVLLVGAYNEGGLWHSTMIEKNLVDFHLPFLPLERAHVKQCAEAELRRRNISDYSDQDLVAVANEMQYFPREHEIYSRSGCKKVAAKVDLLFG